MGDLSDYDDIETAASQAPLEARLYALISVEGTIMSVPLPDRGAVTIGRMSSCDVVIQHASVSRHHATLRIEPLQIIDAGSRNGTRLRGTPLEPRIPTALVVGEAIQIGEVAVLIQSSTFTGTPDPDLPVIEDEPITRLLDMECARSARSCSPFAYVRLVVDPTRSDETRNLLRNVLRTSDALGGEGEGNFQLLLPDTAADQSALAVARMTHLLARIGIIPRIGIARHPLDGVTPAQLVAHAWERLGRAPDAPPSEMDGVRAVVAQVATGDVSVLIMGETGVGKELCAEMIHRLSPRAQKPFVKLNCSAIVESLIESELFGHERGAFTGAVGARAGLFEAGDGGTVFLDEIGELPLQVQAKLLRVLEERIVRRVGSTTGKTLDVRFICATNRVLSDEVAAGRFRADLYYRINTVSIAIPPLRARRPEIAGLARAFATRVRGITTPAMLGEDVILALERHPWPGNVRELRNTVDRAVILSSGGIVRLAHLAIENAPSRPTMPTMPIPVFSDARQSPQPETLANAVADLERERILETLNRHGGNQTRAAKALGISRNTLLARLDSYGLPRPRK